MKILLCEKKLVFLLLSASVERFSVSRENKIKIPSKQFGKKSLLFFANNSNTLFHQKSLNSLGNSFSKENTRQHKTNGHCDLYIDLAQRGQFTQQKVRRQSYYPMLLKENCMFKYQSKSWFTLVVLLLEVVWKSQKVKEAIQWP